MKNGAIFKFILLVSVLLVSQLATAVTYYTIDGGLWSLSRNGANCACTPDLSDPTTVVIVDRSSCTSATSAPVAPGVRVDNTVVTGCHVITTETINGTVHIESGGFLYHLRNGASIAASASFTVDLGGYYFHRGSPGLSINRAITVNGGMDIHGALTIGVSGNVTGSGGFRAYGACANFGTFYGTTGIGAIDCAGINFNGVDVITLLPVELLYFTHQWINNQLYITWETLTEKNNDYFILERSNDGINFEIIGKIEGQGTKNESTTYEFPYNTNQKITYFRLKQVDYDGTTAILPTISVVNNESTNATWKVYPNPSDGNFTLYFDQFLDDTKEFVLFDLSGKEIYSHVLQAGKNEFDINHSLIAKGLYLARIVGDDTNEVHKIIIQ